MASRQKALLIGAALGVGMVVFVLVVGFFLDSMTGGLLPQYPWIAAGMGIWTGWDAYDLALGRGRYAIRA